MPEFKGHSAAQAEDELERLKALIRAVYEKKNPSKLPELQSLLEKHKGDERKVYLHICQKYGEVPQEISKASKSQQGGVDQSPIKQAGKRPPAPADSLLAQSNLKQSTASSVPKRPTKPQAVWQSEIEKQTSIVQGAQAALLPLSQVLSDSKFAVAVLWRSAKLPALCLQRCQDLCVSLPILPEEILFEGESIPQQGLFEQVSAVEVLRLGIYSKISPAFKTPSTRVHALLLRANVQRQGICTEHVYGKITGSLKYSITGSCVQVRLVGNRIFTRTTQIPISEWTPSYDDVDPFEADWLFKYARVAGKTCVEFNPKSGWGLLEMAGAPKIMAGLLLEQRSGDPQLLAALLRL